MVSIGGGGRNVEFVGVERGVVGVSVSVSLVVVGGGVGFGVVDAETSNSLILEEKDLQFV